jgi:adenylate cyclase
VSVRLSYWLIIAAVIACGIALRQADPGFLARIRLLGFDTLQQILPRVPDASYPVRIVDIDERSLGALGSWPLRREVLANLVQRLSEMGARVVVFDMVFPDPERSPLEEVPEQLRRSAEFKKFAEKLAPAGTPDEQFARAIQGSQVVLGVIAKSQRTQRLPAVPGSLATIGQDVNGSFPRFPGATTNVVILDNAASGVGAMNWFPEHDQILRRVPLFVRISDQLYPSLTAEALRLYSKSKTIQVRFSQGGDMAVRIGDTVIPTDRDGQMWLWFSRRDPKRTLSAADVLSGKASRSEIENRIAVIGTSAPGLLDLRATPLDPVIAGVEINAQAIEQLLSQRFLVRPDYAKGMEIAFTVVTAAALALIVYWVGAVEAAVVGAACVAACIAGVWLLFARQGVLLDATHAILTVTATYVAGTGFLYYQTESERNRSRQTLLAIAREMEAAAQIQRSFLPQPLLPATDHPIAFDIFATMKPAKHVGGDFYDYFLIDQNRLAFAVGDVSGKGVPAALFMSVSRTVLRTLAFEGGTAGSTLTRTNEIIARDNAESMFVTLFYAVLHLESGRVEFSSAGHDNVHLLRRTEANECIGHMGPAIGLIEDITYPTEVRDLAPGDMLLLLTDGVTEAFDAQDRVYGSERVAAALQCWQEKTARGLVEVLISDVARFAHRAEQSDDITCLAVQFRPST